MIVIRFTSLILIVISLVTISCTERKGKTDRRNLIPEKELVSILTDIYITDGLLTIPKISAWSADLDSIAAYIQVIENHGYTKQLMDNTMNYYFIDNPKELNKIYDQVLGTISAMDSRAEKESTVAIARLSNKWPGKEFYSFPSPSGNDSTMFNLNLDASSIYTLTYSATLFPDDESVNPRPTMYLISPDSLDNGKKQFIKSIEYIKDCRPHTYSYTFTIGSKIRYLKGWLFDSTDQPADITKHIQIENISITSKPAAAPTP